jgi:hypothetical protein
VSRRDSTENVLRFALINFYPTTDPTKNKRKSKKKRVATTSLIKMHHDAHLGSLWYYDIPEEGEAFSEINYFVPLESIATKVVVAYNKNTRRKYFLNYGFS